MTNPQQDTEEEARRREIATALGQLTGASHVKDVLLDLYAIGGRPVLDAVSQAIGEFPLGRPYLALHIHFGRRREISALPQWPDHLRLWLVRDRKAGLTKIFIHSGPKRKTPSGTRCITVVGHLLMESTTDRSAELVQCGGLTSA